MESQNIKLPKDRLTSLGSFLAATSMVWRATVEDALPRIWESRNDRWRRLGWWSSSVGIWDHADVASWKVHRERKRRVTSKEVVWKER